MGQITHIGQIGLSSGFMYSHCGDTFVYKLIKMLLSPILRGLLLLHIFISNIQLFFLFFFYDILEEACRRCGSTDK